MKLFSKEPEELLVFNGVNASTGGPLFQPVSVRRVFEGIRRRLRKDRPKPLPPGIDPRELSQTGWGVIAHRDEDPRVVEALEPLLQLRREQAEGRYKQFLGAENGYSGQTHKDFLDDVEMGDDPVDPDRLPYYLLLVGDPTRISYDFQQQLDVQYAVGRICFDSPEQYRRYAESVVAAETSNAPRLRKAAFWSVRTPGDLATELSADRMVEPLVRFLLGMAADGWEVSQTIGDGATKSALGELLGGRDTPAVLFTASHGVGFERSDPRQRDQQGALLCQDWPGVQHGIDESHYFCAHDVAAGADVHGLIAFLFACHGAGVPKVDQFALYERRRRPKPLAPEPFVARLPQHLLAHPNGGALAVIGHVDRAWAFSFLCRNGGSQLGAFNRVLELLLKGFPVGCAMEAFNLKYAKIAADLTLAIQKLHYKEGVGKQEIANLWAANNDARGYCVVGDPAVRVAV